MEERRSARIGTVSGLALLTGGTAVAAASGGGTHSIFATVMLGGLTVGLGHSLAVEIKRQSHRRSPGGWNRADTINIVLLGVWAEAALIATILDIGPHRLTGLALTLAYVACCGYFVTERRRTIAAEATAHPPATNHHPAAEKASPATDVAWTNTTVISVPPSPHRDRAPAAQPPSENAPRPDQTGSDHARPDLALPDLARSDLARSDLARSDLARSEIARSEIARSEIARSEIARSDHARPDHARPDHARPEFMLPGYGPFGHAPTRHAPTPHSHQTEPARR